MAEKLGRYMAPLLFAYREVPQASLGFSPFELVYGRNVKRPLAILRDLWERERLVTDVRRTYLYVLDLRNRLEDTCKLAHEKPERSSEWYARYWNAGSREIA